jgi:hypothetical protein
MEKLLDTLNALNKTYDMSQWYCITLWPATNQVSLQGYYADVNFEIAKDLEIELELQGSMLRGENKYYKVTLTT